MKTPRTIRTLTAISGAMWLGACASLATPESAQPSSAAVRVVAGRSYRIFRADPLVLYEHDRQELSGKRFVRTSDRYFSTAVEAPIRPLTLVELKSAFPDNHTFHDLLTLAFSTDADLMRWDSYHHEYLVARLLRQSIAGATVVSR